MLSTIPLHSMEFLDDDNDFVDPSWRKSYVKKSAPQEYDQHIQDFPIWESFETWKGKGWNILYKAKTK